MSQQLAEQFIGALGQLEAGRDVEPLAALYAEESKTGNIVSPEEFTGPGGAREFWTKSLLQN